MLLYYETSGLSAECVSQWVMVEGLREKEEGDAGLSAEYVTHWMTGRSEQVGSRRTCGGKKK